MRLAKADSLRRGVCFVYVNHENQINNQIVPVETQNVNFVEDRTVPDSLGTYF